MLSVRNYWARIIDSEEDGPPCVGKMPWGKRDNTVHEQKKVNSHQVQGSLIVDGEKESVLTKLQGSCLF